jgi:hypothetical protein
VGEAIRTNPGCAGCHDTLDPIAGYLWGHSYELGDSYAAYDASTYHPERERRWREATGLPPAWYGHPGESMEDLGAQIARDDRFVPCAVSHFVRVLLPGRESDAEALARHEAAFREGDLRLRALIRSIVTDPTYGSTRRWMVPTLLEHQIEDLTGFRWTNRGGTPLLRFDRYGLLTLSGGADGLSVTTPADGPNPTILLVQDALASATAAHVVLADAGQPAESRRLFAHVDPARTATPDQVLEELVSLRARIHSRLEGADDPDVLALLALHAAASELSPDPREAWIAVLTALFRDPDFVTY